MLLPLDAPDELKVAKEKLQESALKIQQLAAGPAEFLGEMAVQVRSHVLWLSGNAEIAKFVIRSCESNLAALLLQIAVHN